MKNKHLGTHKNPPFSNKKRPYRKYSYALKRRIVFEVQNGIRSIEQARKHYNIKGNSLIYSWIKKYGILTYDPKKDYSMKQSPKERIKELETQVERLELEKDILLDVQQIYKDEFGIPVKKYLSEQLIKDLRNHTRKG